MDQTTTESPRPSWLSENLQELSIISGGVALIVLLGYAIIFR